MRNYMSKAAAAAVALVAGGFCVPAVAAAPYGAVQHRTAHRAHHQVYSSDVTVRKSAEREPVAPDAFHGPAAIITAPVYVVGTFVSLPFRVVEVVFPPHANDPRVLIGAPIHFAGQIADFPFSTVNGAFGVRSTYAAYN